ncbi:MAG: hypothetical protein AAF357_01775, partial [Verrucomicrobiota bacterium]
LADDPANRLNLDVDAGRLALTEPVYRREQRDNRKEIRELHRSGRDEGINRGNGEMFRRDPKGSVTLS